MPKVLLSSPVRGLQGKFSLSDICYFVGPNGLTYARSAGEVANPQTASQLTVRGYFSSVAKAWHLLTQTQRDGWLDYAKTYFTTNEKGDPVQPSGISTYIRANTIRQVLGLALVSTAPVDSPPPPLTGIAQVGATDPDVLTLTISHAIATVTGLQVMVRMTPQMVSLARAPRLRDQRYCRGVSPDSAVALPASGTDVMFTPTIFSIDDGQRYGVEARVVRTADGIMSTPVFGDFIKLV